MGLIINDEITLENGMQVTRAYLSFYKNHISIIPGMSATLAAAAGNPLQSSNVSNVADTPYTACGMYSIWYSKDAMQKGLKPIQTGTVDYQITKDQTQTALHDLLYSYIKTNLYTNTTDA